MGDGKKRTRRQAAEVRAAMAEELVQAKHS
jgi:hypothetical protein